MIWIEKLAQQIFGEENRSNQNVNFLEQDAKGKFSIDKEYNGEPYNPYFLTNFDFTKLFNRVLASEKLIIINIGGMTFSQKVVKKCHKFDSHQILVGLSEIQDLTEVELKEKDSDETAVIRKNGLIKLSNKSKTLKQDINDLFNKEDNHEF